MILNPTTLEELQHALERDCLAFLPELILCGGVVLLLLLRMFSALDRLHLGWVALLITAASFVISLLQWSGGSPLFLTPEEFYADHDQATLFSGMLAYDHLTVFLRLLLLAFTALVIWLSLLTGIPDREDSADFYTLLLGSVIGMMLMSSTNHLLMLFLSIEMASLPSFALAGYLKGRKLSSEAALKYVVYGGGAAGIMLYGISLLAGRFGTAYLPELAAAYATTVATTGFDLLLVVGTLFLFVGLAFKLALVPFHFWCPDVFEGASAEVAGFLSVASKAAAFALLARLLLALAGVGTVASGQALLSPRMTQALIPVLCLIAIATATFGNLAAYTQNNLKRLLAYSTIAHAGYMLMGIATLSRDGVKAVLFYLLAYLFMNLGAFAVVAFLRQLTGSEDVRDYRGLVRSCPWLVILFAVFLLSLLGVPPLAGFVGKFQIFVALFRSADGYLATAPGVSALLYTTLVFGGVNTVLSAVYYIRVLRIMIADERAEDLEGREPTVMTESFSIRLYGGLLAGAVVAIGLFWGPLDRWCQRGIERSAPLLRPTDEPSENARHSHEPRSPLG